jgi:hypothetical protein
MAYPRSKIVLFDATGTREISYEETEHFAVTRHFLNDHQRMVEALTQGVDEQPQRFKEAEDYGV